MFNSSIPNNYIYTSNRGTEYMYLSGSWINCNTMKIVENSHTFKMNQSAIRQISEHNQKNSLKIGKKYIINECEYTYIGRNNFSLQGNILSENMNSYVHKLVEANDESFSNFSRADVSLKSIPNKFLLVNGKYTYNKTNKTWYDKDGPVTDKQFNSELTSDAYKDIQQYNSEDRYPVNSTIQYGNKIYTYTGTSWVSDDGKIMSDKFLHKVDEWLDENPNAEKEETTSTQKNEPNSDAADGIKVGQQIKDKNGKIYKYDGKDFVDSVGDKLSAEQTASIIKKHKDWQSAKQNGTESDYNKNNTTNLGSEQPKDNKVEQSTNSSIVPDRYVYTSDKGKSYIKKNGQWFSTETNKPINSSSSIPLERAAEKSIDNFNKQSPIKIGQEWTSNNNKTFKYIGGDRFISDDGKLLPKGMAMQVLDKLKQSDNTKNPENNSDNAIASEPAVKQNNNSIPQNNNVKQPTNSNDELSSLETLANNIKNNPEAGRIITLLSRGDNVSLLAADILLSGKQKEISQLLKSLNNEG